MAVREDLAGTLVEKAAIHFDLRNPLGDPAQARDRRHALRRPRRDARAGRGRRTSPSRASWCAARVVDAIGFPDPAFFIFYDDVDFAIRARRAGFRIWAVRDAVLVRQLDFDQQHDLDGWKGFYMYRNLFVVHLRYGENALVRLKPWLITARGGAAQPAARRSGRGAQRDPRHGLGAGHAGRPTARPDPRSDSG